MVAPSEEDINQRMWSYKSEGGSAVHQTWFAAAVSYTLPNLQISAISVAE